MKGLVRWAALMVFIVVAAQWWEGSRSWELVTIGAIAALAVCWACGGFDKSVWFGTPDVDAECVRVDAELDALDASVPIGFEVRS
ncbi:hypothetical protein AB0230_01970 [Microbacterium sp. NPDC089190]|uniref:hypothetical protein n=1 Tax=Microbacterium sp. NPDC089190 TaxID=3155063 RepID=UPI00344B7A90